MEEIRLDELFNKEFYIVDCNNFIFYPREVRVVGFEISPGEMNVIMMNLIH